MLEHPYKLIRHRHERIHARWEKPDPAIDPFHADGEFCVFSDGLRQFIIVGSGRAGLHEPERIDNGVEHAVPATLRYLLRLQ
jgi:hypothetical protein